jgi:hypothetical protein
MGFRFRKSISICPGVRLNFGKSGFSNINVGPRGASVSLGKRGTHVNVGLPGTGLSYRTRLDNPSRNIQPQDSSHAINTSELTYQLEKIESEMEAILHIHMATPNLDSAISLDSLKLEYISIASKPFSLIEPVRPNKPILPPKPELQQTWLGSLFSSNNSLEIKKQAVEESINRWEAQNVKDQANYTLQRSAWASEYAIWKNKKDNYHVENTRSKNEVVKQFETDNAFFEEKLGSALAKTAWPRETNISFEVDAQNTIIKLSVDLPEIEDVPNTNYKLNKRGTEILQKIKSAKQLRLEYARLVHGILFRVTGIALYNLPFDYVEICGFTQRLDKATGYISDDYILDVKIKRNEFLNVNFDSLQMIDPIDALEKFELNRSMTSTGIFTKLI